MVAREAQHAAAAHGRIVVDASRRAGARACTQHARPAGGQQQCAQALAAAHYQSSFTDSTAVREAAARAL